ncbi:flagellar hook-associated protein FlgK [Kordiimonas aestuarii]|uniref:flagellar hook-associated protein FlgK n=1 Tax=Kordiimonas aestuarii TaxID=1005925 RepID=UPI0021D04965|nr:flagellar hook-associated protein FlgK [Kordiimonas aestuarii]
MSLNGILNTSLSGLFTNQSAIRVTSNNIANVNTEGYARNRVVTESQILQGASAGVNISEIQRVVDRFLEGALRTAGSNTAEYSVQREFHDRLQGVLGDPASGSSLSARIDDIFSAVSDLALNPADVLRRQQSLSEIESFTDQINLFQQQIQNLRAEASQQISETVNDINSELQRIAELNPLLVRQKATGGETGGLEGQLGQSLNKLAELVDIKVDRLPSGGVTIATQSGYPLFDSSLTQLDYDAPGVVDGSTQFPKINIHHVDGDTLAQTSSSKNFTQHIRSGKLAGLLAMRDEQLVDLSLSLGELSARVMDEFNAVQNQFSAVPAPNTMTGKQTIVDGGHATGFSGVVTFAVVDASNDLVQKVTVDFDSAPPADFDALISQVNTALGGAGTLSLTNGVMSFSAANSANGVVIADDVTTPSDRGGRGFSHYFGMNDLLSASSPGIYDTGLIGTETHGMGATETMSFKVVSATGAELDTVTLTVGSNSTFNNMVTALNNGATGLGNYFNFTLGADGEMTYAPTSTYSGIKLEVISDNTSIGGTGSTGDTGVTFTQAFGIGDNHHVNAAKDIELKPAIKSDPNLLALSVFDTSAAIGEVVLTDGDQRGALAFQQLETSLVSFAAAGELKSSSVTLSQYVARFLGNAGLQAQRAQNLEEDNIALQQEVAQRNADVSGVNMDEELANLVVYQNAYSAAARVLSSVQELYDNLLAVV